MPTQPPSAHTSHTYTAKTYQLLQSLWQMQAIANDGKQVIQSVASHFLENLAEGALITHCEQTPYIIGIGGASGSGKSFLRDTLVQCLSSYCSVADISQDHYYVDFEGLYPHIPLDRFYHEINLDDPAYIRFDKMAEDLSHLKQKPYGETFHIPEFRFGTPHQKPSVVSDKRTPVQVARVIISEGIHAFYHPDVLTHYDLKVFVEVEESTRKSRWVSRNLRENRGTTDNMWQTTVDCLNQHILPTRQNADIILHNAASQSQITDAVNRIVHLIFGTDAPASTARIA
ncbi:MAG: hypothetical protein VKJ04_02360 [Vampirovibrionales bacterium]|nr:hypothetical protein [Vampirovibrionales bacterium]